MKVIPLINLLSRKIKLKNGDAYYESDVIKACIKYEHQYIEIIEQEREKEAKEFMQWYMKSEGRYIQEASMNEVYLKFKEETPKQ